MFDRFHQRVLATNAGWALLTSGAGRVSVDDWLAKRQAAIGRAEPAIAEGVA